MLRFACAAIVDGPFLSSRMLMTGEILSVCFLVARFRARYWMAPIRRRRSLFWRTVRWWRSLCRLVSKVYVSLADSRPISAAIWPLDLVFVGVFYGSFWARTKSDPRSLGWAVGRSRYLDAKLRPRSQISANIREFAIKLSKRWRRRREQMVSIRWRRQIWMMSKYRRQPVICRLGWVDAIPPTIQSHVGVYKIEEICHNK